MENTDRRIAVLIDADNVSDQYIEFIFDEITNYGAPTYKRIYGDWTKPQLASWKKVLLDYSITPIQQYSYTTGKNSTDSALIIDSMDILYSANVDGFCIVSSDSDFTRLAARLREDGMFVIGMGEKKTPAPFVNACEQFKYLEVLAASTQDSSSTAEEEDKNTPDQKTAGPDRTTLSKAIRSIINDISNDDGWASLGPVGSRLNKRYPAFDSRNYGYQKLSQLMKSFRCFEVYHRKSSNPHVTHTFIRNKEGNKDKNKDNGR
jgi:uncharacterized LabA/DUF88 family protein